MIQAKSVSSKPWFCLLVFGVFWLLLCRHLALHWAANPQYSFGWLVPVLAGYLLWRKWEDRPETQHPSMFAGGITLAFAAFLFFPTWLVAQPNPDWRLVSWALALEIVTLSLAAVYLAGGRARLWHFAFPIAFLLTAVPWPFGVEQWLIQSLTRLVAAVTVELLNLFAIPAVREGNVIHIRAGALGVDDACSGVRSLQATFMATLFLGELYRFNLARRVTLLATGVLLAIACNIGRAFLLAWVAAHRGIDAVSSAHDPAGFTILTVCFLGAWGVSLLLARGQTDPKKTPPSTLPSYLPWPMVAALAGWLVFSLAATEAWYCSHEKGDKIRWNFAWPQTRDSFKDLPIAEVATKALQYNHGRAAQWRDGRGSWVAFFFQWDAGPARSRILARSHRPDICLPASGFKMRDDLGTIVVEAGGLKIPFRASTFAHDGEEVHVFYCLWEDGAEVENTVGWSRGAGFETVRRGQRNLGQQVLEIVLIGYPNAAAAEAAFKRELPKLIRR